MLTLKLNYDSDSPSLFTAFHCPFPARRLHVPASGPLYVRAVLSVCNEPPAPLLPRYCLHLFTYCFCSDVLSSETMLSTTAGPACPHSLCLSCFPSQHLLLWYYIHFFVSLPRNLGVCSQDAIYNVGKYFCIRMFSVEKVCKETKSLAIGKWIKWIK